MGFALSQSDEDRLRNSAFATEENKVREVDNYPEEEGRVARGRRRDFSLLICRWKVVMGMGGAAGGAGGAMGAPSVQPHLSINFSKQPFIEDVGPHKM